MDEQNENRRPIASRDTAWARWLVDRLKSTSVTPNGISLLSVLMAALAGVFCYCALNMEQGGWRVALFLLTALAILLRLVCNMLDGMLAYAKDMKTATGAVYNELPDRVADTLIIIAVGYGLSAETNYAGTLGWVAAFMAVMTAYVRVLGGACGVLQRFIGPMAKQQRMFLIILASLCASVLPIHWGNCLLLVVLWVILVGSIITIIRRTMLLMHDLEATKPS